MSKTLTEELNEFAKEEFNTDLKRISKECIICGTSFEAKTSIRKYCDQCQKNPKKAREYMEAAIGRSKYYTGERYALKTKRCFYCDKEFVTTTERKYCSDICERRYKIENNTCIYCGELLYPEIQTIGKTMHPACKEAYYKAKGRYRKCENCNKEYYAKHESQRFCCYECSKPVLKKNTVAQICYTCCICKQMFTIPRNRRFDKYPEQAICSNVCETRYKEAEAKRIEALNLSLRNQQIKKMDQAKREREKKQEEKFQKEVEQCGLCGFCKTSYKDCDLMQSEFRVKPKGAKYNGNGKIVICPKFRK